MGLFYAMKLLISILLYGIGSIGLIYILICSIRFNRAKQVVNEPTYSLDDDIQNDCYFKDLMK